MFRLALFTPIEQLDRLAAAFATRRPPAVVPPCYDFGPGGRNVVVYESRFGRLCRQQMAWGLVPGHLDPRNILRVPWTVATIDEARDSRVLRHTWRAQRCVVPVDAIFAFGSGGRYPQRYCVRRADSQPFFVAAVWDGNDDPRELERGRQVPYRGFCLLTRKTIDTMATMFPDVPVILSAAAVHSWATPAICETADIERLALPDSAELVAYPVNNDAKGVQLLVAYTPPQQNTSRA
jgi:putative SOS response-associated peptidase YedK